MHAHLNSASIIDIKGLFDSLGAVMIVKIDTSVVDQNVDMAVLLDLVFEGMDALRAGDVEAWIDNLACTRFGRQAKVFTFTCCCEELDGR